jgi:hypothetical protein
VTSFYSFPIRVQRKFFVSAAQVSRFSSLRAGGHEQLLSNSVGYLHTQASAKKGVKKQTLIDLREISKKLFKN